MKMTLILLALSATFASAQTTEFLDRSGNAFVRLCSTIDRDQRSEAESELLARCAYYVLGVVQGAEFGATVESAEITELRESTYFARIQVKTREGKNLEIDSRPSDAIALALRTKSPIYVAKKVLEASSELHESQGEPQTSDQNLASVSRDKWSEILERMSPEDFKYKM